MRDIIVAQSFISQLATLSAISFTFRGLVVIIIIIIIIIRRCRCGAERNDKSRRPRDDVQ